MPLQLVQLMVIALIDINLVGMVPARPRFELIFRTMIKCSDNPRVWSAESFSEVGNAALSNPNFVNLRSHAAIWRCVGVDEVDWAMFHAKSYF